MVCVMNVIQSKYADILRLHALALALALIRIYSGSDS